MSTLPELKILCEELEIDHTGLDRAEMMLKLREVAGRRFKKRWGRWQSADTLSPALKRFLTLEFDYVIRDKEGNELSHLGKIIKKKRKKPLIKKRR